VCSSGAFYQNTDKTANYYLAQNKLLLTQPISCIRGTTVVLANMEQQQRQYRYAIAWSSIILAKTLVRSLKRGNA
jgi:hypothetical protein